MIISARFLYKSVLAMALFAAIALSGAARAQSVQCCNTATGDWSQESSAAACQAKPGVAVSAETMGAAQICFQKTQEQAQSYMQDMMNMTALQSASAAKPSCCNAAKGEWAGEMTAEQCLANPDHYPDIPDYLTETQACRPQSGGGGAWDPEDFEDNFPNGGMETWKNENNPRGYASFGVPKGSEADAKLKMQTVFQSSDAHTGQFSAELRNFKIGEAIRRMGVPTVIDLSREATPAGMASCKDPCPMANGMAAAGGSLSDVSLPIAEAKSHICGAYKGFISPQDELAMAINLVAGGQVIAGTDMGAMKKTTFTESHSDWHTFAVPFYVVRGSVDSANKVAVTIQVQPRNLLQTVQATGMVGRVSPDTKVKIDSIHFCEPVGATIYEPRVTAIGSDKAIPDKEEESKGAQTFVNLDNDDKDQYFDFEDKDGVEGDDELVRVRLKVPADSYGTAELAANGIGDKIEIWKDADKKERFEHHSAPVDVETFFEGASGDVWTRDVWIEALKPSTSQNEIKIDFTFTSREAASAPIEDTVTLTAIGVESIVWKGKGNSFKDDDNLDEDPNWPSIYQEKSYRVFPGKRLEGDKPGDKPKNIVDVEVTLSVKPVRPIELRFRALDIDDPTATDDEVDKEESQNDNRGKDPNHWGGFPDDPKEHLAVEFDDVTKTFPFQVTMQPGDNFRIVGGGDVMTLMELENDDKALAAIGPRHTVKIVDPHVFEATQSPGKAQVREHEKYASEILTVWRKLYIEMDSMQAVKDNTYRGEVVSYRQVTNTVNNGLMFVLTVKPNIFDSLPENSKSERTGMVNAYLKGKLYFTGWDNYGYDVFANTANASGPDDVTVVFPSSWGAIDDSLKTFRMIDDDAFKDGDALPAIAMDRMETAFAPAYVLPVEGKLKNPTKTVPFRLHYTRDDQDYLRSVYAFDNKDHHEDKDFWVVYLLNAFQGILLEDADGDKDKGAIAGQADSDSMGRGGMGAAVYQESGRELAAENTKPDAAGAATTAPGWGMSDVAPHEIGHLFGGGHRDGGLMDDRASEKSGDFSPVTLDKIRGRAHP